MNCGPELTVLSLEVTQVERHDFRSNRATGCAAPEVPTTVSDVIAQPVARFRGVWLARCSEFRRTDAAGAPVAPTQRVAEAPRDFRVNACLRLPVAGATQTGAARTGRRDSDDVRPSPGLGRKSGRRFTADQAPRIEESVSQLPHAQPVAHFLGVQVARCSEFWGANGAQTVQTAKSQGRSAISRSRFPAIIVWSKSFESSYGLADTDASNSFKAM